MYIIRCNHWFIKDNSLSISLAKYVVTINIKYQDDLLYELQIISQSQEMLAFNFYTLEDAIRFTENVIANTQYKEEIINAYLTILKEKKYSKNRNL